MVALEEGCRRFGHLWYTSAWFDRVTTLQAAFLVKHLATHHAGLP